MIITTAAIELLGPTFPTEYTVHLFCQWDNSDSQVVL